tara:strand:- start:60 stop:413 length:354 start_codon:yes stop_codon:yes gene_type:complete
MTLQKEIEIAKIEVSATWNIHVVMDIIVREDGVLISKARQRKLLVPFVSQFESTPVEGANPPRREPVLDSNGNKQWTHTATDISGEDASVQAIANTAWTDEVKTNYKAFIEAENQGI